MRSNPDKVELTAGQHCGPAVSSSGEAVVDPGGLTELLKLVYCGAWGGWKPRLDKQSPPTRTRDSQDFINPR